MKPKKKKPSQEKELFEQRKQKVAEKIKMLRMKAGYKSSEMFAFDFDLPRVQYWRMEKGTNFTFRTLNKVLAIHNISPSEFFLNIF